MDPNIKRGLFVMASESVPIALSEVFTSGETPEEKLAKKYGEIAQKMGKQEKKKQPEKERYNIANYYRNKLMMSKEEPCGLCIRILEKLSERPLDEQMDAVPYVAEAEGASEAGGDIEQLKEIMSESDVLREIIKEVLVEKGG